MRDDHPLRCSGITDGLPAMVPPPFEARAELGDWVT